MYSKVPILKPVCY